MKTANNSVTQIRLPDEFHKYVKEQSQEMGISQNSFMIVLMKLGRKIWDADISHREDWLVQS